MKDWNAVLTKNYTTIHIYRYPAYTERTTLMPQWKQRWFLDGNNSRPGKFDKIRLTLTAETCTCIRVCTFQYQTWSACSSSSAGRVKQTFSLSYSRVASSDSSLLSALINNGPIDVAIGVAQPFQVRHKSRENYAVSQKSRIFLVFLSFF